MGIVYLLILLQAASARFEEAESSSEEVSLWCVALGTNQNNKKEVWIDFTKTKWMKWWHGDFSQLLHIPKKIGLDARMGCSGIDMGCFVYCI